MSNLLAARSQMALSLGFHILFAVAGIGMPLLMVIAEGFWLKTKNPVYLELTQRWSKGLAVLFAVGAVSGTVLSFELGLLWPRFMAHAGPVIGMPFSLEGFAFFLEAIFLGIYLYGWKKVSPAVHWFAGWMVLLSGTTSAIFVVTANAWMNTPTGFQFVDGNFTHIDPFAAMFNPMWFYQSLHMVLAAFQSVGFMVAGIHAYMLLKNPGNLFHRAALTIGLLVGTFFTLLQPISGDWLAENTAKYQPVKLAAMEAQWETERGAPLRIGGWPDTKEEKTVFAIQIPKLLSFLAYDDFNAEVKGLKSVPPAERPPVAIVHIAFQIMVACEFFLLLTGLVGLFYFWRLKKIPEKRGYLWLVVLSGPLGFLGIEAGWTVTEVGRQPWIVYGLMKTADSLTPMPMLIVPFLLFTGIYLALSFLVLFVIRRQVMATGGKHATL